MIGKLEPRMTNRPRFFVFVIDRPSWSIARVDGITTRSRWGGMVPAGTCVEADCG